MNPLNEEFTKIYFYATAGLRLIPPKEAEILLDYIRMIIEQTVFIFEKANVRIIEGDEEGIALWFAINYLENNLNGSDRTLGVHDLGGGNSSFSFFFFFHFLLFFKHQHKSVFHPKGILMKIHLSSTEIKNIIYMYSLFLKFLLSHHFNKNK